jgi:hypothetical protein
MRDNLMYLVDRSADLYAAANHLCTNFSPSVELTKHICEPETRCADSTEAGGITQTHIHSVCVHWRPLRRDCKR